MSVDQIYTYIVLVETKSKLVAFINKTLSMVTKINAFTLSRKI